MKKFSIQFWICITISLSALSSISAQETPVEKGLKSITTDAIKGQLGFLASDWTEGREAGQKGEFMSADYIASILQMTGVKPAGDFPQSRVATAVPKIERSYFQNFTLLRSEPGKDQIFLVKSREGESVRVSGFNYGLDFYMRPQPAGVEIEAPVVFAGYGFRNDNLKFNDFRKLDIRGKFILKIAGVPAFAKEKLQPEQIASYNQELETYAKSMGAAGIIEFNPNSVFLSNASIKNDFLNMSPSEMSPRSTQPGVNFTIPGKKNPDNLIRITISAKAANEILKGTGIVLDEYLKKADISSEYSLPEMKGKTIYFKSDVINTPVPVRNVLGVIEGKNPDQVIVVGAHYDHMGMNNGYLWNGADDNGSGTVGAMTIARAIVATGQVPEKTIIIALWTAEEKGLLGSRYYVDNLVYPKNIRLNLNLDMISRYIADNEPDKVLMTYSITYPGFRKLTEDNLSNYHVDINMEYQPSTNPPGGSDHQSFVAAGIPVMRFKPGHREEYHTPADELSTVDWDIMEKIIKISFLNIWELANTQW